MCLHLLMQMKPKTVAGIPCHSCDYLVNSLLPEWDFNLRDYALEKREKVREAQFCCLTLFDHSFLCDFFFASVQLPASAQISACCEGV